MEDQNRHTGIHGIGMSPATTWEQKQIIINITHALKDMFDDDYIIVPEWVLNFNDLNERQPDVNVFDKECREPLLIIEITPKSHYKKSINKIKEMMNDYETIEEGYVYDYERNIWHCQGNDTNPDEPSYSPLLDVDFNDLI